MTEPVWTDFLPNPETGKCPVPNWAEEVEVMLSNYKKHKAETNFEWDWSTTNRTRIMYYRYAIPASLYRLVKAHKEWPMEYYPSQIEGWARVDWLKAREDLGMDDVYGFQMRNDGDGWKPTITSVESNEPYQVKVNATSDQSINCTVRWSDDPVNHPTAADFLKSGLRHMEDRATTYDKPNGERSMYATVRAFEAITGISMTEEQGWLFMGLLKDVRSQQGDYRADNYEDRAAYAGLQGEAAYNARGKREEW